MTKEVPSSHDEGPAIINDHAFDPRGKWWDLCKHCGLARASHRDSTIDTRLAMFEDQMTRYGKINHVDPVKGTELERELERARLQAGGRVRISYVGDDDD